MSTGERVSRAAGTIRARWERGVEESPQVDAARALDDAGMLLDRDVANELAAYRRAREGSPLSSERLAEIRDRAVYLHGHGVDADEYELELSASVDVPDLLAELERLRAREESPLGSERLADIRSLDLLVMMSDRSAAVVGRALGDLLDEVERLRSRVAELEDAAYGDAEVRLLSPVGQIRHLHQAVAAQMSRAETLDRLCRESQARVAELEALTPATVQTCRVCGAGYTYGQPCSACEFQARIDAEAGESR